LKGHANVTPDALRRPPAAADEWRLVTVTVRVIDLERDGDTWRAEAELASGERLPIAGLAGSGTNPEPLQPGRSVRFSGIVRRAHPSATDQRFAVAPRSPRDIKLGPLSGETDAGDAEGLDVGDDGMADPAGVTGGSDGAVVLTATLGSLDALTDRFVRVGGRLETIEGRRLTLDDGTARGRVRLAAEAGSMKPAPRPGEVVNATGRVERGRDGPEVVVGSVADLRWAAATAVHFAEEPWSGGWNSSPASSTAAPAEGAAGAPTTSGGQSVMEGLPLFAAVGLAASALLLLAAAVLVSRRSRRSLVPVTG
jgi:hypothetical protein